MELHNRNDIDGLRGWAIIFVVIFHAFPTLLPGGFIGVDVFFIISGFLITSIIFKGLQENKFSFVNFYLRRVKRLFPALILVFITLYIIGWFFLSNKEFSNLGKQIFTSSIFLQNIYLLQASLDYFNVYTDDKQLLQPLVHLWSLSVEEQFYLIWPGLIYLAWKRHWILSVTAILFISSFTFNIYWSISNPVEGFYSPISRIWEPIIGAFLAYQVHFNKSYLNFWSNKEQTSIKSNFAHVESLITSIIGLTLIIMGLFVIRQDSRFPGWLALFPTVGTFLLIKSGTRSFVNKHFLSNKIIVWFGKISYPLYLWHWPILSFAFISSLQLPSIFMRLLIIIVSIMLAWFTYAIIEYPIRFRFKTIFVPLSLCCSIVCVGFVGLFTFKEEGFASRFPSIFYTTSTISKAWREDSCFLHKTGSFSKNCVTKDTKDLIIIWGDSNAASFYPGFESLQKETNVGLGQFTISGCPPVLNYETDPHCNLMNSETIQNIEKLKPRTVVLISSWGYTNPKFLNLVVDTIKKLKGMGIPRIVLIGPVPLRNLSLSSILLHRYYFKDKTKELPLHIKDDLMPIFFSREASMSSIARKMKVNYISIYNQMCIKDECLTRITNNGKQYLTSFDGEHITPETSIWLMNKIKNQILHD